MAVYVESTKDPRAKRFYCLPADNGIALGIEKHQVICCQFSEPGKVLIFYRFGEAIDHVPDFSSDFLVLIIVTQLIV